MNDNEKKILVTTSFGHFMSHFNMLTFPALVIPLGERFGLEIGAVIALSFWMYLLFGLTALPWGLLTDRHGAKPLLLLFYLGAGASALAAAVFMDFPGIFSMALAGLGLFSGIYHPAGLGLISRGISRMSVALGYNGMAGNAGLAAAPILAGLINYQFGARAAYVAVGMLNLLGAAIMVVWPSREPARKPGTASASGKDHALAFAVLCVCMMLGGVAYRGATVILPSYIELRSGGLFELLGGLKGVLASKNVAATAITSLIFLVGVAGQYLGGRLAERFDPRRGYLAFHFLALPMALLMAYATDTALLFVGIGYMLFLLGMQPMENTLVATLTPERLRHSAYGTKFILTFGVGALGVHVVGWIKQAWSLEAVFIALTLVSCGIVMSIVVLIAVTGREGPHSRQ